MRHKFHIDALAQIDAIERRGDAEGFNAFFSGQLEQIRPTLIEKKYPEFKARKFLPIKNDIHPGAEAYTERTIDEVGEAEFVTDLGDDAPMVEISDASSDTNYMRMIALKYGWHLQEARNAQFAGVALSDKKALACRKGIERFLDRNLLVGATVGGKTLQGLFSLSGGQAPLTYVPALTWDDETSDTIYASLMDMASYSYEQTKEVEMADTMIMPTTVKRLLMNRRMGDSNNMSILKFFLESQEFVKNVETSHYLEVSGGHSGGATRRIVTYKRDPEVIEGLVNEFEQLPPEYRGGRVDTTCLARVGGVLSRRPKSVTYADGV